MNQPTTIPAPAYAVAVTNEQTGRIRYLAPGGALVAKKADACPLAPEVAERLALAAAEVDAGRHTVRAIKL